MEAGLVEAHGVKKGRTYTLSPRVYREFGQAAAYVRQAGFEPIQQEQMILRYVREHGRITRSDVVELCQLGEYQAPRLLQKLARKGELRKVGERKGTFYERAHTL